MKIRRIITTIFLLLIMILPIAVIAETCDVNSVKIESLSVKQKNGNVQEVTEATKNGTEVNVNLNMQEVGDSIIYETIVKNSSNEDYYLDDSYLIVDTDYMEYSITSEDDSNIIKANSKKKFDIKVKYRKEVEETAYVSGKYSDTNNLQLSLKTESKNPFTADYIALYLSIFYLSVFGLMYLFVKKRKIEEITIVLLAALLVPLSVNALCKAQITVNSKVNIEKKELSIFRLDCSPIEFKFYKGMTFGDWVKSSLYEDNIEGTYNSLEECENIFGTNRGCAFDSTEHVYGIKNSNYRYRYNEEDCDNKDNCVEYVNQLYAAKFAYRVFDTNEQCKNYYDGNDCEYIDGKYMVLDTTIHESEEACNEYIINHPHPYQACSLIPKIYKEEIIDYSTYSTLEECERVKPLGKQCEPLTFNYYKPTLKETNYEERGRFTFNKRDAYYHYIGGVYTFNYNDVLKDDSPYICGYVG